MKSEPLSVIGEGLVKRFRRSAFALDVSRIEAPAGETLVLLGPSGSGKSTLLHLLGLLEKPDAGRVLLGGQPADVGDRQAQLSIAAVFQRPYLFKGSVGENVGYGLKARGVSGAERASRVAAALENVGLAGFEQRSALLLSGGEAQRVSLARALVLEPRVLLLDEPLSSLDPLLKRRLTREFAEILRRTGATVMWVTHDQDEALLVADHVAIMRGGSVVSCGSPDEVMGIAGDEWTASFLGIEPATQGTVTATAEGLTGITAGRITVHVNGIGRVGDAVLFSVRPEDVLLFAPDIELPATTARNRLEARVTALEPRGTTFLATLDLGGVGLASLVSRTAVNELGLAPGSRVLAVFKATAVRWRPASDVSPQRDSYTG